MLYVLRNDEFMTLALPKGNNIINFINKKNDNSSH